ncbi:MAG TPA: decaprenyl-phosphate phosphoribosyltransferase [Hyphomicrobiaceae bacterium]|jgi:4-hydroxybenzoate polyprenyltransferase
MEVLVSSHPRPSLLLGLASLLRPRQWIKSAFVLAPLIFSGAIVSIDAIERSFVAMIFFCVAASAVYVLNDIIDMRDDKRHPDKVVTRPLAAGAVTVFHALVLLFLLYGTLALAWVLAPDIVFVLALYVVLNVAYALVLKHQPVIDIFTIAIGFVLRVYAGAMAIGVQVSQWMFVTTLCLALYLAATKRRQELSQVGVAGRAVLQRYTVALTERFAEMSSTGAILFYSLYVMSSKPQLVVTIPIVLFGLYRYAYAVEALGKGQSPTDVLWTDRQLALGIVVWVVTCVWLLWPSGGG